MTKSEFFDLVLEEVCKVCQVRVDSVINGMKFEAVVDARVLATQYLHRMGFSFDDIALMVMRKRQGDMSYCPPLSELKKKSKGIAKTFDSYSRRCLSSKIFKIMSVHMCKFCDELVKENLNMNQPSD